MASEGTDRGAVGNTTGRGVHTRRLVLGASAALAAIVVVGLGDGALAAWFRAAGGGAAVGFAVAVLIHARSTDDDLKAVRNRFGPLTLAFICALGVGGAVVNFFVTRSDAEHRRSQEARDAVSRFISGQGLWAGQPAILDTTVRSFGNALRDRRPLVQPSAPPGLLSVHDAVTRGPIEGKHSLTVEGIVCSRYGLVPNAFNRNFGFKYMYRLVSPGGRDEVHVVSGGGDTVIGRGLTVRVTGLIAASGPRRDNDARSTVFVMGLTSAHEAGAGPTPDASKLCGDTR